MGQAGQISLFVAAVSIAMSCQARAEPASQRALVELRRIAQDLSERLAQRGVSAEEAEQVAALGDETATCALFGFTLAECHHVHQRVIALVHGGQYGEPMVPRTPGWDQDPSLDLRRGEDGCSGGFGWCLIGAGVAGAVTSNPGTGLVVMGVGFAGCYCTLCRGGVDARLCRWFR